MLRCPRSSVLSPTAIGKLSKILSPFCNQITSLSQNPTLKMESLSNSKRPTCPNCSRPLILCLCARFQTPIIDNKIHITILQHSLEKKHPLNSARIARLGLRNVDLFTVSDVLIDTQFVIRSLGLDFGLCLVDGECKPGVCENVSESFDSIDYVEVKRARKGCFDLASERFSDGPRNGKLIRDENDPNNQSNEGTVSEISLDDKLTSSCDNLISKELKECDKGHVINVNVGKYGEIKSIYHPWKLEDDGKTLRFEHLIASPEAVQFCERGYVVKKMQNEQKEEFEIEVPQGSVLLFPAQNSIPIEAIDFDVKKLIVLDGTWTKANRMYKENPWLRVLPCVKLDADKISLFSEVRRQPKPGCLSTIESIVYALKALGETDSDEGLCKLLDVFESMVEDQRRCKDERVRNLSSM